MVKAIHEKISLDRRVLFHLVTFIWTLLPYLPIVLLILNLAIFVSLHIFLIVISSIVLTVLPQFYLFFYYRVMKHFEKDALFDRINRLAVLNGIPFSIIILVGIIIIINRYGGLL